MVDLESTRRHFRWLKLGGKTKVPSTKESSSAPLPGPGVLDRSKGERKPRTSTVSVGFLAVDAM